MQDSTHTITYYYARISNYVITKELAGKLWKPYVCCKPIECRSHCSAIVIDRSKVDYVNYSGSKFTHCLRFYMLWKDFWCLVSAIITGQTRLYKGCKSWSHARILSRRSAACSRVVEMGVGTRSSAKKSKGNIRLLQKRVFWTRAVYTFLHKLASKLLIFLFRFQKRKSCRQKWRIKWTPRRRQTLKLLA